ncbi:MAG: COX15/CtaA family protein [Planctomycetota bacterium]
MSSVTTDALRPGLAPGADRPTAATRVEGTLAAPRARLRQAIVVLCLLAVPLTAARSWQLVWQPLIPLALLYCNVHTVARVQTAAVLLLLMLGAAVTTYRVGMAVPDWPGTFSENMWTFPLSDMLERGYGVTLEHTHRLWASGVGLVAICQVLVAHIQRERRAVVALSWAALVAISFQGLLGGTRVLENSQHLAFLHGALAQAVFAVVVVGLIVSSRRWRAAPQFACKDAAPLRKAAALATLFVYVQIVLGAATRHSGANLPLGLHLTLAIGVLVLVTILIGRLGRAHQRGVEAGEDRGVLRTLRIATVAALHTQILLGILVTVGIFMLSGGFEAQVSVGEAVFASLHVAGGAVLLATCVAGSLWSWRLLAPGSVRPQSIGGAS